jgi:hypothetical protein
MPPMPVYYVGKGTQFRVLDMFDGTDRALYDITLERLKSTKPLAELAQDRKDAGGSGLLQSDVEHFRIDWLQKWWPALHVDRVLRAGIRKAIETALPNERHELLPIEALWVCSKDGVFQVYVNEGPHQVTVIVYTPPPEMSALPHDAKELIWVVKTTDEFDERIDGEITFLTAEGGSPVLIERQLRFASQSEVPQSGE